MLLVARVKSSSADGTHTPCGTVLHLEVDLPQATGGRLDIEHVALRYRVSTKTVGRWVEQSLVPYFRIGSNVYFKEAELDAMEAATTMQRRGPIPLQIRERAERMAA